MDNDVRAALLGDHEAAKRLTEKGALLPCPWCGRVPDVEYDTMEPFEYVVFCGDCGVMPSTSEDEKVARKIWNTRAPVLTPEQIEALERLEAKE